MDRNPTILMITRASGRPFVPDLCDELILQNVNVYHYILDDAVLIHHNEKKSTKLKPHKILKVSHYLSAKKIVALSLKFDVVHFHTAKPTFLMIRGILKPIAKSFVCTIWGSEFYKSENHNFFTSSMLKKLYSKLDKICFTNVKTLNDFKSVFPMHEAKLAALTYPLKKLDIIDSLREIEKEEAYKELGIESTRKICCIGYSASKYQNHIQILEEIIKSKSHWIDTYVFVLPMTYNGLDSYKEEVYNFIKDKNIEFKQYKDYLTDRQMSLLRIQTDLFIQLLDTDQFSGSTQEVIFAGNKVVTGDWLPYDILKREGIKFFELSSIDQLHESTEEIDSFEIDKEVNRDKIYAISGMKTLIPKWVGFYNQLAIDGNYASSSN